VVVEAGETLKVGPIFTKVPPQEPVYHATTAPVPKLPPVAVNVIFPPLQIVVVPEMDVGAVDNVFTVTVADAHEVVLQVPLYRTK